MAGVTDPRKRKSPLQKAKISLVSMSPSLRIFEVAQCRSGVSPDIEENSLAFGLLESGSLGARGARPPKVPSCAPRARHGEIHAALGQFFPSRPARREAVRPRAGALPETFPAPQVYLQKES